MSIPIYIIATCIVVFTFVLTVVLYFQVYKRQINRALDGNARTRFPIAPPHKVTVILLFVLLSISVVFSYFAGYANAYKAYEADTWVLDPTDVQTFYAEIESIDGNRLTVTPQSFNDETNSEVMAYDIYDEQVSIYKQNTVLSLSDLSTGDLILITLLTNRSGTDVFKIQLEEQN